MKTLISTLFFTLFLGLYTLQGQDRLYIIGPFETCIGSCETYTLDPSNSFIENVSITYLDSPNTNDCYNATVNNQSGIFTVCYYCPGTYYIDVLAFTNTGTTLTDSIFVNVSDISQIKIFQKDSIECHQNNPSDDCLKACAGSTVTYGYSFPNPFAIVTADVVGATSYVLDQGKNEITVTWGSGGFGSINITSFGQGTQCFSFGNQCIEITDEIEVDFNIPGFDFCVGESIEITPLTLDGISYSWDFGNGHISSDIAPVVSYDKPGTYQVSLTIITACGCTASITKPIITKESYLPVIDCKSTICENTEMTYTTDSDCGQFFWKIIGDGTIKAGGGSSDNFVTVDWGQGPLGIIELEVASCNFDLCPKKAIFDIPIISENAKINGQTIACKGSNEMYSIQKYNATGYQWNVTGGSITAGQGSNTIIVAWSSGDQGTINVTYDNCYLKCGGSDELTVALKSPYKLSTDATQICHGELLTAQTTNDQNIPVIIENWEVRDENNVLLYTQNNVANIQYAIPTGITKVIITTTSPTHCNGELTKEVTVLPKSILPAGIKGEKAICKGNQYLYEAIANLPNASYQWEIKDGSNVTAATGDNILVTWQSDGPYQILLTQTDLSGAYCASSAVALEAKIISTFTFLGTDESCLYSEYNLKATFYESLNYEWEITPSDAATIISQEGSEVDLSWSKTGTHTITLKTCAGTYTKTVLVHALPEPVVNHPATLCEGTTIAVSTTLAYEAYNWLNDDSTSLALLPMPNIKAGTYVVQVTDNNGCIGKSSFTIVELPKPNVYVSTPQNKYVCLSSPPVVYPTLHASEAEDGYTFEWFKNETSIGIFPSKFKPSDIGKYKVKVTDNFGCTNESNTLHLVDICDPTTPPDTIGGGGGSSSCISSIGSVGYTFAANDCNSYTFTSTSSNIIADSHRWFFDDNASSNNYASGAVINHEFSNPGYYEVVHSVRVVDSADPTNTCVKKTTQIIEIPIKADFEITNGCRGDDIVFTDLSTHIPDKSIVSWTWDFGDPLSGADNTSTLANPIHVYNAEGSYTVKLIISDGTCTDEISHTFTLRPQPSAGILALDANCEKETTRFNVDNYTNLFSIDWTYGDPTSGANDIQSAFDGYHRFESAAFYNINALITSVYGCKASINTTLDIKANTLAGNITTDPGDQICQGESTKLSAPVNGVSWNWSSEETTDAIEVSSSGIYLVTVTDVYGCTYTPDQKVIQVNPKPKSYITSIVTLGEEETTYFGNEVSLCQGQDFKIFVPASQDFTFNWQNNITSNELSYSETNGNLLPVGVHLFYVELTDVITGCSNVLDTVEVTVNGNPNSMIIQANQSGVLCAGIEHNLSIINPVNGLDYLWNNGETEAQISTSLPGQYFVQAQDDNGCKSVSNTIEILSGPDVSFVPSGCFERCAPDTLCFPSIANVTNYQWQKDGVEIPSADGGNIPYIILTESATYQLELTGQNGCKSTSEALSLTLNQPVGVINIIVYSDVNENNIIDAGDTLVPNITINITGFSTTTDESGHGELVDVPAGSYHPQIDENTLPDGAKILIDSLLASIVTCEDTINVSYLIGYDCPEILNAEKHEVCFGQTFTLEGQVIISDTTVVIESINSAGCVEKTSHEVKFSPPILFTTTQSQSCPGESNAFINVNVNNPNNFLYHLNGVATNVTAGMINGIPAGEYTLILTDQMGCIASQDLTIADKAEAIIEVLSSDLTCTEENALLQVNVLNYDESEVVIEWSNGDTESEITVQSAGTYSVNVFNGCVNTVVSAVVNAPETNHTFQKFIVCSGYSFDLLNQTFYNDTTLYFTAQNAAGCIDTTTYDLQFGQRFEYILDVNGQCPGKTDGNIQLEMLSAGQFTYTLNNQAISLIDNQISNLNAGNYELKIKDVIGCAETLKLVVKEKDEVKYRLLTEDITCFKGYAALQIVPENYDVDDLEIKWSNGKTGETIQVTEPTQINVTISNGCETIDATANIVASDRAPSFVLPNIMSPNFDGANDVIDLEKTEFKGSNIKSFTVMDRAGRMVHRGKNMVWDGRSNSLDQGVYFYTVEAEVDICGKLTNVVKSGTITIIR